jgi:hypothetical protein
MSFEARARYLKFASYALAILAGIATSYAGVTVSPMEVFATSTQRSSSIVVANPSDKPLEVWISFNFGYPVRYYKSAVDMDSSDASIKDAVSAIPWIRAIPQRFILPPNERQVVRIMATPPATTVNGEYWARVVISSKDTKTIAPKKTQGPGFAMELVTQTVIPYHFRRGVVTTGVTLQHMAPTIKKDQLELDFGFARTGNAAFWGRIMCRLLDKNRKEVAKQDYRLVVYTSMNYTSELDISSVPPGEYTLEMLVDEKHPSVAVRDRLRSNGIKHVVPLTIP